MIKGLPKNVMPQSLGCSGRDRENHCVPLCLIWGILAETPLAVGTVFAQLLWEFSAPRQESEGGCSALSDITRWIYRRVPW